MKRFFVVLGARLAAWSPAVSQRPSIDPSGGAVERSAAQNGFGGAINAAQFGAVADGSDQTAKVQLALNFLSPALGGIVTINQGVRFDLRNLKFPARATLEYFRDSDLSQPGPTALGTNERVEFIANSNAQGLVNEKHLEAAFDPANVVNLRKDVLGQAPFLGAGQSMTHPARAYGLLMQDEGYPSFATYYQNYLPYSPFSGVYLQAYRRIYTLEGVGAGQWTRGAPAGNALVTGATSGAKGFVMSITAGATNVLWYSGRFVAGEKLIGPAGMTEAAVTQVVYGETNMPPLAQSLRNGDWSIGVPPDSARALLSVGGEVAVSPTRTSGQYVQDTVVNPAYAWVDDFEGAPPRGYEITYDVGVSPRLRRLWLRDYGGSVNLAPLGLTRCLVNFSRTALVTTSGVNVASIKHTATGKYTIVFSHRIPFADYTVSIGNSDIADNSRWKFVTTDSVQIWNYNSAAVPADLVGAVAVTCTGGDIG
jgi:hypothetical protein